MIKHSPIPTPNETLFGFVYYALQLLIIPAILLVGNSLLTQPYSESAVNFVCFAINFLAVTVIFHKFLLANLQIAVRCPWRTLQAAGIGMGIYLVGTWIFTVVMSYVNPEFTNINDQAIMQMVQENYALMSIGTVLLVPLVEECFYRGLFFRKLFTRSKVLAYIVSMVIFGAAHVAGYIGATDWATLGLCFLQYLPASFALSWSYHYSGTLFAPILIHMTVNQMGMLAMR